jgi:hypothetical protein
MLLLTRRGALGGIVRLASTASITSIAPLAWVTPLALCGAAAGHAATPPVTQSIAAEVRAVIEAQLAAFAADDAQRAFSYAAPSIRTQFGDADRFIAMVRTLYPVVYRPRSVSFLEPAQQHDDRLQAVRSTHAYGGVGRAMYRVQRQPDGAWRIGGCGLQRLVERST